MPKYIANAYLVHNGAIVQSGGELELTEEQAERLGDKVSLVEKTSSRSKKQETQE